MCLVRQVSVTYVHTKENQALTVLRNLQSAKYQDRRKAAETLNMVNAKNEPLRIQAGRAGIQRYDKDLVPPFSLCSFQEIG